MLASHIPDYFLETGWKNPDDANAGPFQYASGIKHQNYFEALSMQPYYQRAFNTVMSIPSRRSGKGWFEFFPVEEKLRVQNDSDVVLVDVGGGQGKDITAFHEHFPNIKGKLILQDLPVVIDEATTPSAIEVQGHDFFHEQPVKGAKAYYLRTVIHDWPDKQAKKILGHIRDAMGSDSLLLLDEGLLPESNISLRSATSDLIMMVTSGLERTKDHFESLLDESGFELVNVWLPSKVDQGNSETIVQQAALLEARVKSV